MKEPKYFLDTNIFLRAVVNDQKVQFEECRALLKKIHDGKLTAWTSSLVLTEIQWTLKSFYGVEKTEIVAVLEAILAFKTLKFIEKTELSNALTFYANHQVKFVDCLIASIPNIQNGRMKVISYDKEFDKLGVGRIEPKQLI